MLFNNEFRVENNLQVPTFIKKTLVERFMFQKTKPYYLMNKIMNKINDYKFFQRRSCLEIRLNILY